MASILPKMSQISVREGSEGDGIYTYSSGYMTFTSTSVTGNRQTLPDKYHHDFLSFLSLAQQLQIDFMSINWQPALSGLGFGGSSQIMQSNMITRQLAFAFKRTVPKRDGAQSGLVDSDKQRFRALICEILILKNPTVRDHPNINQLEGIAWEIQNDVVWPVLVFPKANAGSLKDFVNSIEGKEASFEAKLRLCIDVALALLTLHRSNIIHGDIKPANILVSHTGNSFVAKVTDFESSCIYGAGDDLLTLRKTIPWEAPEWHDRYFEVKNAKRLDVYSFGLLCFWTLFRDSFGLDLVDFLPDLKAQDEVPGFVDVILDMWSDLSPRQNSCLSQFFKQTVCFKPEERELDFEKLIMLLTFNVDFQANTAEHYIGDCPDQHTLLSIIPEFSSFTVCDYRVRKFLETSFKSTADGTFCNDCAAQAAFQLALSWKIGFFIPENEHIIEEYLLKSGRSWKELENEVRQVQSTPNPRTRVPRTVYLHETSYDNDIVFHYQFDGVLDQAEKLCRQEIRARSAFLGQDHILTREAQETLGSILRRTYRWKESRDILDQVLQSEEKFGREASICRVLQSLAALSSDEGRWAEAESLQQRALAEIRESCGDRNVLTLQYRMTLASIYHGQGKWAKAADIHRSVIHVSEEELGLEHLHTIDAMGSLADALTKQGLVKEALEMAEEVVARKQRLLGEDHPSTLNSDQSLARIYLYMGNVEECDRRLKSLIETQTLKLGALHHDTLSSIELLVNLYMEQGKWKTALELEQDVVEKRKSVLGPKNPYTLRSMATLGTLSGNLGEHDVANNLVSYVVEAREGLLGKYHPDTITGKGVLSSVFRAKGALKEAEQLGFEVMESLQRVLGGEHPETLDSVVSLAATYIAQDRLSEASALLKSTIEISTKTNGPNHPITVRYQAVYIATVQDAKEAEMLRRQVLDYERERLGDSNPSIVTNKNNLAISLMKQGQWKEAEDIFVEILPVSKVVLGPVHKTTLAILVNLSSARCEQGHWEEAKESFEEAVKLASDKNGEESASALTYKSNLASVLMRSGKLDDAAVLNETVLNAMEKLHGEGHQETMRVMNNLAASYSRQKRWRDAQAQLERLVQIAEKKFEEGDSRTESYRSDLEAVRSCT